MGVVFLLKGRVAMLRTHRSLKAYGVPYDEDD
jgi:hypothetical protein